jgi:hypothetical protein
MKIRNTIYKIPNTIFKWFTKTRRRKMLSGILTILIVLTSIRFVFFSPRNAQAAWSPDHTAWGKRKRAPVVNNSTDSLAADTTIAITVNTKDLVDTGKLQKDCDDLRVLYQPDSSTNTELTRYLSYPGGGSCSTSEATKVYFPLQATLASDTESTDYYIYYDNDTASAPSSTVDAFDTSNANALLVCPFDGTTDCVNSTGTEQPTTESGAIRYSGSKSALSFDGQNGDYVNSGSNGSLDNIHNGSFTVEGWFYIQNIDETYGSLLSKGSWTTSGWGLLGKIDSRGLQFRSEFSDTSINYSINSVYNYNEWTHIAVVYNSDTQTAQFFINGTAQSPSSAGSGNAVSDASENLIIGNLSSNYKGYKDEIRISDIARYTSNFTPSTSPFVRDEHTKLLLHFDENGDDPRDTGKAIDDSGNGNDGTITGAKYVGGLIGTDGPQTLSGVEGSQEGNVAGGNAYAGHEGVFLEEGTTNKVTNPSFENVSDWDVNWSASASATLTQETSAPYFKFGSSSGKMVVSGADSSLLTSVDVGNTNTHTLSSYVYDGTTGNIGGTVSSSIAQLMFNATPVTTTFTDMGGGWWRLSASAAGISGSTTYGVEVKDTKTVYIDGVQLEEESYATTYTDGSLGSDYSWNGTENDSTSHRNGGDLQFSTTNNINASNGSVSVWIKPSVLSTDYPSGYTLEIFSWVDGNSDYKLTYPATSDVFRLRKRVSGTGYQANVSKTFTPNEWIHLVATWSSSSGIALYVNNGTPDTDPDTSSPTLNTTTVDIGSYGLNSVISDFQIFDTALSSAEVQDLYYSGLVSHRDDIEVDAFSGDKGQDPVGIWHFDESYGSTAHDSSQYGNDLTVSDTTWETQSVGAKARLVRNIEFDGSTSIASRSAGLARDFNFDDESFSISGWFRRPSGTISNNEFLISKHSSAGYGVYLNTSGQLCFGIDDDSTFDPDESTCTESSVADSRWHFFEAVKDGTSSISLYIDSLQPTVNSSLSTTTSLSNNGNFAVGVSSAKDNYYTGFIDELVVYPYARDASQVKEDYLGNQMGVVLGTQADDFLTNGLVGYWKMDETSGTNVADSSGNGNDGTLTNAQESASGLDSSTTTTITDTDNADLSGTNDVYIDMILSMSGGSCNVDGEERTISDYDGTSKIITVGTAYSAAPDTTNCTYTILHQIGGKFGNGVDFDGSNDYVSITDPGTNSSLDLTNMTISIWFYLTSDPTGWIDFVSKGPGSSWNYVVEIDGANNNEISWGWWDGGSNGGGNDPYDGGITTGQWYHYAITYNDSSNTSRMYLNGSLVGTKIDTSTISPPTNNSILSLGSFNGSEAFIPGKIDDTRIYNRALSPAEVAALYKWAPGPVAYYSFDEGTGQTAYDKSGNGNNATLGPSLGTDTEDPTWTDGKYGKALNFDGSDDDYTKPPDSSINTDLNAASWMAWVYYTEGPDNPEEIINAGWNNGGPFDLEVNGTRFTSRILDNSSTNSSVTTGDGYVQQNTWQHVAVTYNNGTAKIYLDGVEINSSSAWSGDLSHYGYEFCVGGECGHGNPFYFEGKIDEVKFYNYARTPEQIIEDMNAGHPAPGSPVGSPVGYWKFDEGYGDTAYDSSPQGNNGNLGGGDSCPGDADTTACPAWTNDGKIGKALDFDTAGTTDDYVQITETTSLEPTDAITVSFWGKSSTPGTGGNIAVLSKYYQEFNVDSYSFPANNSTLEFYVNLGAGACTSPDAGGSYWDNNWHHIVGVYDITPNTSSMYVDGKLIGTSANCDSYGTSGITYNSEDLFIGARSSALSDSFFNGSIDEVKVYNFALSADQVKTEYNQGKAAVFGATSTDASDNPSWSSENEYCPPGQGSACTSPVAEWKFDEKTGQSANDTSENNNTGTLIDGPVWKYQGACEHGACLEFDDSSDEAVDIDSALGDLNGSAGTISAWIYRTFADDVTSNRYAIYLNDDSGTNEVDFSYHQNGDLWEFEYIAGGTTETISVSASEIPINIWSQIALTWSSTDDEAIAYINGVNKGNSTGLGTWSGDGSGSACISGTGANCPTANWGGMIDTVRIYDYARTPAQIAWEYNRGGPVGWWKLDDNVVSEGDTVSDSSGNGNDGTLYGDDGSGDNGTGMDCNVDGKRNTACDFDGSDDYISIASTDTNNPTGQITVSAWIKPEVIDATPRGIISKWGTDKQSWALVIGGSGLQLYIDNDGTGAFYYLIYDSNPDVPLQADVWNHIVFMFDGTDDFKYYINGIEDHQETVPFSGFYDSDEPIRIGQVQALDNFYGQIDEVKIWNYALTDKQVQTLYNDGAINFGGN